MNQNPNPPLSHLPPPPAPPKRPFSMSLPMVAGVIFLSLLIGLILGSVSAQEDEPTAEAAEVEAPEPEVITETSIVTETVEVEVEVLPPACEDFRNISSEAIGIAAEVIGIQGEALTLGGEAVQVTDDYWQAPYGSYEESVALGRMTEITDELNGHLAQQETLTADLEALAPLMDVAREGCFG